MLQLVRPGTAELVVDDAAAVRQLCALTPRRDLTLSFCGVLNATDGELARRGCFQGSALRA